MTKILFIFIALVVVCPLQAQQQEVEEPLKNFESLWNTFNQRYANFELKKVDWTKVYQKYKPQINEQTTNLELFEIACTMVQELSDGHVSIYPEFEEDLDWECGPPYDFSLDLAFPKEKDWRAFKKIMEASFQSQGFSPAVKINVTEETNFQYRTSEQLGYLRLDEMTERSILIKLNKALKEAFEAFSDKKGIIIDLRFNGGGYDPAAMHIAGFLSGERLLSHTKYTRIKGTDKLTKGKKVYLKPKTKKPFTQKVIVLVSDFTASAAEVFLLAVKDLPHVILVGENSEGIFSDMYEFRLPNKWEVSLSHMQFIASDGQNYEGIGIKPDFQVVNTASDLQKEVDPVLAKAFYLLENE